MTCLLYLQLDYTYVFWVFVHKVLTMVFVTHILACMNCTTTNAPLKTFDNLTLHVLYVFKVLWTHTTYVSLHVLVQPDMWLARSFSVSECIQLKRGPGGAKIWPCANTCLLNQGTTSYTHPHTTHTSYTLKSRESIHHTWFDTQPQMQAHVKNRNTF